MPLSIRPAFFRLGLLVLASCSLVITTAQAKSPDESRPEAIGNALAQASSNQTQIQSALDRVPSDQRPGMEFLVANMPPEDLQTLPADFLIENCRLAYQARAEATWNKDIPSDVFLNDILPYASVNERRDAWRQQLHDLCRPIVVNCRTPGEAARRLNEQLFGLVKVKYSTQRRKAHQSPLESMASGLASCTGLSILLIDACRSVGVPARLVGTPNWIDKRGNHTWVEIWDQGWHFVGAAEPDPGGLDRGWFVGDASRAIRDSREHAIYATSFRKTPLAFPLVWAPTLETVCAVNVTDRYTIHAKPLRTSQARLFVKVTDRPGGQRVAAEAKLVDPSGRGEPMTGTTRDERFDTNDLLTFDVDRGKRLELEVQYDGKTVRREIAPIRDPQSLMVVAIDSKAPPSVEREPSSAACAVPKLSPQERKLKQAMTDYFMASPEQRAHWQFDKKYDGLLLRREPAVRQMAWDAYRTAPIHDSAKADYEAHRVQFEKYLSPYTVREVGKRPDSGWPLFIAMHGGGNAPKELNDRQWVVMQTYYHDHPEVGGYLYLALRAPNDTWNGFYDTYVYPLIANLIRQFLLFGDVDANKVFIMGYSHGGYGAFAIGPKTPDRFAAVHVSAAAPTDGETSARTLRNTPFTVMVGEKDLAYGRYERDQKFAATIRQLRGNRTDIYPVTVEIIAGNGHTGLPDRDKIKAMYPAVRNPVPAELDWELTDEVVRDFFWLHVPAPTKNQEIIAACHKNSLEISTKQVASFEVLLDSRLADLSRPMKVELNGKTSKHRLQPSVRTLCETLVETGDPNLAFAARLTLRP